MTQIYLARHGETAWNANQRIQGFTDSQLNQKGRGQAKLLAARLANVPTCAIYTSDLSRTYETAGPLSESSNLPIVQLRELREKSYGDWEGRTASEVKEQYPELWHQFHTLRDITTPIPAGETWLDVQHRVTRALQMILRSHPGDDDNVIVIGHGGSLRMAIIHALDAPLGSLARMRLDNCGLTVLDYRGESGGRVLLLNDTSHLENFSEVQA